MRHRYYLEYFFGEAIRRIMVISSGKLVGFIDIKDANQEKVLLYATGKTE